MNTNNGGPLSFEATLNNQQFNAQLTAMENRTGSFTTNLVNESQKWDSTFNKLGVAIGAAFTFQKAESFVSDIIKVRGEFQQLDIAFTSIIGNKAKANDLMNQVVQTALQTPFSLRDLAQGAKQLLAYGTASDKVNDTLKRLGNVASGLSIPINDLIYLYGTLQSQGRAYAVDIKQFAGRGIPIYEELAKVLGVSKDKVNSLVEAGKVGFPEVQKVFQNLTNAGGDFYNLMEKQSKTLSGQVSNLGDAWDQMLNKIGASNEGVLSDSIAFASELVQHYEEIGKVLAVLITTYGAYKAAVAAVSLAQAANAITNASVAASVTSESGAIAQNIALKIDNAKTTAAVSAAIATETAARAENAMAIENEIRSEFAELAAKEATAIEIAKNTALILAEAEAKVEAATAAQAKARFDITASSQSIAAKQLEVAENELLIATEEHLLATKEAASLTADVNAKKYLLDSAAKDVNTASTLANSTALEAEIAATNVETISKERVTIVTLLQTKAQAALNLVMDANPFVLIATAVAALAVAYYVFHDSTTNAEKAQKAFNEEIAQGKKAMDDLKSKTSELTSVINSNTATQFEQLKAFKELQVLYPDLIGKMSLHEFQAQSTEAQQLKLNDAIDNFGIANLQKQYDEGIAKIKDLEDQLKTLYATLANSPKDNGGISLAIQKTADALEQAKDNAAKYKDQIADAKRIQEEAADQERVNALPLAQRIAYYEQLKNEIEVQIAAINQSKNATNGVLKVTDLLMGKVQGVGSAFGSWQPIIDNLNLDRLSNKLIDVEKFLLGLNKKNAVHDKAFYDDQRTTAQGSLDKLPTPKDGQTPEQATAWKKLSDTIEDANNHLDEYSLKVKKLKKEDIVLPSGSVGEYDRLLKKANEAITQTPTDQTQRVKDLQDTILDLTQKRADAQKIIEVRTWQETLDYKKQQYEQYEGILDKANGFVTDQISLLAAQYAPDVFKDLLAGGQTYYQFLKNRLDPLSDKVLAGTATTDDLAKILQIQSKLDDLDGRPSQFEQWSKDLENTKTEAGGTSAYLDILRIKRDALNAKPIDLRTNLEREELKKLNVEFDETSKKQTDALRAFLLQQEGSADQLDALKQKYKDLREEAENQGKPTDVIDKAEAKESTELALKASNQFKALNKVIIGDSLSAIDLWIERLTAAYDLAISKGKDGEEDAKKIANEILQAQEQRTQKIAQNWESIGSSVQEVGEALQGMEGILGAVGSLLAGAASESSKFSKDIQTASKNTKLLEKGGKIDTGSTIASAVEGIANLSSMLINSIEKKKADKNSRELDAINFQVELNKALSQELLLRSQLAENVYFEDYAGRIQDSIGAATDALTKYNDALANLADQGKSLTGTTNAIDWGNVGKGALTGAGTGAIIGAEIGTAIPIPVIGTVAGSVVGAVVGAVVGGIVGLISTKTKNLYGPLLAQYPQLIDANGQLNKTLAETLISTNQVDDKTKLWLQDLINASDAMEAAKKQIDDIVSQLSGNLGNDLRDALVNAFEDGEDAATAFSKTVEKTLNNVLSNLIFSAVFKNVFDNLQKQLEDGLLVYGTTGQLGNVMDAFDQFIKDSKGDVDLFNQLLKAAQEKGELSGLNLFSPDDNSLNASAAQGISRSITEDTADVISGQINAMRVNQAAALSVFKTHTNQFEMMIHYQSYLVRIDQKLAAQAQTPWRALGLGEDPEH